MTGCPFELTYLYNNCLWSTQIGLRGASQVIAQSNQSTQEQMGNATGGESGGGSQDTVNTTVGALSGVGDNIQQAFRGLGALPFHEDFTDGSFGAFQN